jgi:hypothetical protein
MTALLRPEALTRGPERMHHCQTRSWISLMVMVLTELVSERRDGGLRHWRMAPMWETP